jgi:hypothetical protein
MTKSEGFVVLRGKPTKSGKPRSTMAIISHRGGGWYEVRCMGSGKRCAGGTCVHTADLHMRFGASCRPIKQVPVEAAKGAA